MSQPRAPLGAPAPDVLALLCGLLRCCFRCSPPSRCPAGAVGVPRRGVGRPRSALPGRAAGAAVAGCGSGGGGRVCGVPAGRVGVHPFGYTGGAFRGGGGAGRAAARRTAPDRVSGRTLLRTACGRGARGRRRECHAGTRRPDRRGGPGGVRGGAARGHRAGVSPVGQPRGGHRAAGVPGGGGLPGRRCAAAGGRGPVAGLGPGRGRLVVAHRQRAQVGRPWGWGCSWCARGSGTRRKGPGTSGSRVGRPGSRTCRRSWPRRRRCGRCGPRRRRRRYGCGS
ncbi:hypothetical protein STENM327S_07399 [Streptomyces tendae]